MRAQLGVPFTRALLAALTAIGGAGVGLVVGAGEAAAVDTDQSYWVPVSGALVLRGHGYGHGHGMSQYGAQGAALQGLGYRQILDFYYPGTTAAKVGRSIRVLITADTTADLQVRPTAGLTLRDRGDGATYLLPEPAGVKRWRLTVDADNLARVSYLSDTWHAYRPGGKVALQGVGELFAVGAVTLVTPSGAAAYRGALRAAKPSAGSLDRDTVNVLSLDDYVKGVIPAEMPASWHREAVQAQAVAARTYGSWSRAQYPSRYFHICDTTSCQVYAGVGGEDSRASAATDATAGEIRSYGGVPAFTQFSSSSGGWTSAGSVPYLPAKADPYDDWSGNPVHSWSTTVTAGAIERAYPAVGKLRRVRVVSRDGNGQWRGRAWSLVLDGTKGDVVVSGDTFRSQFALRSTWFAIDPTPIISRWRSLGGAASPLGPVVTRERAVVGGSAQGFDRGRIFYSRRTGANELYGPILASYRSLGGPRSRLGLPVTGIKRRGAGGFRARFDGGIVFHGPATGTVPVLGAIADAYRAYGGVGSALGWPVRTNRATAKGERADFEHGYVRWVAATGRTRVVLTG